MDNSAEASAIHSIGIVHRPHPVGREQSSDCGRTSLHRVLDYWGKVHAQISAGVGQALGVPVKTAAA